MLSNKMNRFNNVKKVVGKGIIISTVITGDFLLQLLRVVLTYLLGLH